MDLASRENIKSAYLAWGDPITDPAGALGQLHFDVVIAEDHERTAEVTSHTVEQGAAITDHVRPNPDRLSLHVFVSNTPINSPDAQRFPITLQLDRPQQDGGFLTQLTAGGTSGLLDKGLQAIGLQKGFPDTITANVEQYVAETDYVQNAYHTLTRLRNTAQILSIVTPREFYTNMVLERVGMHRDASTGTSATFELEFREIRIVSSNITAAPLPTIPRATPNVPKGKIDPAATDGPKQSIAVREALRSGISLPGPAAGFPAPSGP